MQIAQQMAFGAHGLRRELYTFGHKLANKVQCGSHGLIHSRGFVLVRSLKSGVRSPESGVWSLVRPKDGCFIGDGRELAGVHQELGLPAEIEWPCETAG